MFILGLDLLIYYLFKKKAVNSDKNSHRFIYIFSGYIIISLITVICFLISINILPFEESYTHLNKNM